MNSTAAAEVQEDPMKLDTDPCNIAKMNIDRSTFTIEMKDVSIETHSGARIMASSVTIRETDSTTNVSFGFTVVYDLYHTLLALLGNGG